MVYINPDEVNNDYIIAKRIIDNQEINSMFFVGSRVTEDIKFCLKRAFYQHNNIKNTIWEMFVIHELTHKILNNKYDFSDQISGEELSLSSTIFANPYLGLSVMYSYLNYNAINPHRIAAMNFVKFIAKKKSKKELISNPGLIKNFSPIELKSLAKNYFNNIINSIK